MTFASPFCEPQVKACLTYTKLSMILSGKEFPDKVKEGLGSVSAPRRGVGVGLTSNLVTYLVMLLDINQYNKPFYFLSSK